MNENPDKSGIALRQVALVNLILTLYNVMAMTPISHRKFGAEVTSLQTGLREACRQLVPITWYQLDRRLRGLYQYGSYLQAVDPDVATWRALIRYNPVPNKITQKVNKAVNRALIEYSIAFRDLDDSYERWFRQAFWPFARFEALQVLSQSGQFDKVSTFRALELVGNLFNRDTCNYCGLLPRGEE